MARRSYRDDDDFESLESNEPDYEAMAGARYGDPESAVERAERSYERYVAG